MLRGYNKNLHTHLIHSLYKLCHVSVCLILRSISNKTVGYLMTQDCFSVRSVAEQLPALYQIQSIISSPHVVGKWTLIQAAGL